MPLAWYLSVKKEQEIVGKGADFSYTCMPDNRRMIAGIKQESF